MSYNIVGYDICIYHSKKLIEYLQYLLRLREKGASPPSPLLHIARAIIVLLPCLSSLPTVRAPIAMNTNNI